jgi:hypothetical protein
VDEIPKVILSNFPLIELKFHNAIRFFWDFNLVIWHLTVGKKGYFFRETLELLNRSSDVGDPFW